MLRLESICWIEAIPQSLPSHTLLHLHIQLCCRITNFNTATTKEQARGSSTRLSPQNSKTWGFSLIIERTIDDVGFKKCWRRSRTRGWADNLFARQKENPTRQREAQKRKLLNGTKFLLINFKTASYQCRFKLYDWGVVQVSRSKILVRWFAFRVFCCFSASVSVSAHRSTRPAWGIAKGQKWEV